MKPKIIKYIIIVVSIISLIGVLFGSFYFAMGTISFFNDNELSIPFIADTNLNFKSDKFQIKTVKRSVGVSDIELHYLKKRFNAGHGDTTITLKYITLKNSRYQYEVQSNGLPAKSITGPKAINKAYYRLESLKSIPYEKLDKSFWQKYLLSRIGIKSIIYLCIVLLILSITVNAFKTTPFTHKIKNKLYLLTSLIFLILLVSWIFNIILAEHLLQYYKIYYGPNFSYTWLLMGILMLFISTIFNYGLRLQKEQDLTI